MNVNDLHRLADNMADTADAYDKAIESCADDPRRMNSFCTAQGDDLDDLYSKWRDAVAAYRAFINGQPARAPAPDFTAAMQEQVAERLAEIDADEIARRRAS